MQRLTKLEVTIGKLIGWNGHANRLAFYSDTLGGKFYPCRTGMTKIKTENWSQAQSQPERSIAQPL